MGKKAREKKYRVAKVMAIEACTPEHAQDILKQTKISRKVQNLIRGGTRPIVRKDKQGVVISVTDRFSPLIRSKLTGV